MYGDGCGDLEFEGGETYYLGEEEVGGGEGDGGGEGEDEYLGVSGEGEV